MKFCTYVSVLPTKQDDQKQAKMSPNISTDTIGSQKPVDFETYFSTTREFWPKGKELRIESEGSHAGFTKLILINENRDFKRQEMTKKSNVPSRPTQVELISRNNLYEV